jgi:uncharacterized membrane protein
MNWLQWIPNFFKGMNSALKELVDMAGGQKSKRGQFVFWICFLLGVVLFIIVIMMAVRPAFESVSSVLSHFSINIEHVKVNIPSSIFPSLLVSILMMILSFLFLAGIAIVIAAFISTIFAIVFGDRTQRMLGIALNETVSLLNTSKNITKDKEVSDKLEVLYERSKAIESRFHKSWGYKVANWPPARKKSGSIENQ